MQGKAATLLRERREALNLTQYEVAQRAGVREYDVSRWERGKTRALPLLGIYRVCQALDLNLEDIAEAMLADAATTGAGGERGPEASQSAAGDEAVELAAARLEARRKRRRPGSSNPPESGAGR